MNTRSLPRLNSIQPIWMAEANAAGWICYLGTCYHLLSNVSVEESLHDAKKACGNNSLAIPRSPLELVFLRNRLASSSNFTRAWVGLEINNTKVRHLRHWIRMAPLLMMVDVSLYRIVWRSQEMLRQQDGSREPSPSLFPHQQLTNRRFFAYK